jgi:hypothetical protein
MDPIGTLAPIIAKPATIILIIAGLAIWATLSAYSLRSKTSKLLSAIRSASARIAETADSVAFAAVYESVSGELANDPILGPRWSEFRETLLVPASQNRPVRTTARPDIWFNEGLLRSPKIDCDTRYHAALPNLLVGAGLTFTFIGLAFALHTAKDIVAEGATQQSRNAALGALLGTASFKFFTSLAGLFLSIVYQLFLKRRLRTVDSALDEFCRVIEARMPLRTAESLAGDANQLLESQLRQLETFSTDLTIALSGALDEKFDQRLGEHIGPLREVLERLSGGLSSRTEDTLQTMMEVFLKRLEGGAGDQMHKVGDTIAGLGGQLQGLQSGLGEAAAQMAGAADKMAVRMGEGAEAASNRLTTQVESMVGELRRLAESSNAAGAGAIEALSLRISAAAAGFEAAAGRVSETLSTSAAATGGALGRGAEQAVERIAAATEGMRVELQTMLAELRGAMIDAGDSIRQSGAAGADTLRTGLGDAGISFNATLSGAAQELQRAGERAGSAIQSGGETAGSRLVAGGASVEEAALRMAGAADKLAVRMGEGTEATTSRLTTQVEGMVEELRRLAESSNAAGAGAVEALSKNISAAAAGFETVAAQVGETLSTSAVATGGALGRGAEQAVERIAAATEGMRVELQTMLAELRGAMIDAGDSIRQSGAAGADSLRTGLGDAGITFNATLSGAAQELQRAGERAGAAIQGGGETAGASLAAGGASVSERAADLAGMVESLNARTGSLAEQISRLISAGGGATAPLERAAGDLLQAANAAQASLQPLVGVAEGTRRTLEVMSNVGAEMLQVEQRTRQLIEQVDTTTGRFEGVDKGLAGTLQTLQDETKRFMDVVTTFMRDMDKNLANSVAQLGNMVRSLEHTAEDLRQK